MFNLTKRVCQLSLRSARLWAKPHIQTPIFNPLRYYCKVEVPSQANQFADNNQGSTINKNKETKPVLEDDPLRICVQGLGNYANEKDILKFCKQEFNPPIQVEGITKKQGKAYAFLSFASPEEKIRFEKEVVDKKFKNSKLKTRPFSGEFSVIHEKKVQDIERKMAEKPKTVVATPEEIEAEMSVSIQDRISPLWNTPYLDQIKLKHGLLTDVLKKVSAIGGNVLRKEKLEPSQFPSWLNKEGPCCEVSEFVEADSDKVLNYRNKSEFTIGESYHDKGKIKVGFNAGNFNKGFMFVENATGPSIIPKEALTLAKILEKYVQESGIPAYERLEHKGVWRNFIVRQSEHTKEILVSVVVAKKNLDESQHQKIKEDLGKLFTTNFQNSDYKIVSVLVQDHSGKGDKVPDDVPTEIVYGGQDFYMDEIMGFKFRVTSSAFLQVNSPQCEKLYSLIKRLSGVDKNTTFLDICCGIGTIGICVASNANKIVGVEMVDRAVEDAKYNSELNGLKNVEYHLNKVENVIKNIVQQHSGSSQIIGVVDPPRSGLHKDVVSALRQCKGLDKIIYVSCNPEGNTIENLLGLCLPSSKKRRGPAFTVTQAYGVDLFPQTRHFEGVFVLERIWENREEKKEAEN